jgi:hypothetical protein
MKKIVVISVIMGTVVTFMTRIRGLGSADAAGSSLHRLPLTGKVVSSGDGHYKKENVLSSLGDAIIWCIVVFWMLYPKGVLNKYEY